MYLIKSGDKSLDWDVPARLLHSSEASTDLQKTELAITYFMLLAGLGSIGSEFFRLRRIHGLGPTAMTKTAEHGFIFPPQEAMVLRGKGADGKLISADPEPITLEHKRGTFDPSAVQAAVSVVVFRDAAHSLQVYDLMHGGKVPEDVSHVLDMMLQPPTDLPPNVPPQSSGKNGFIL